jgi:hypothetical protein
MTLFLKKKKKTRFPLDNEWCDEKKEEENSKNYTSPTVAIILGHVTSLK